MKYSLFRLMSGAFLSFCVLSPVYAQPPVVIQEVTTVALTTPIAAVGDLQAQEAVMIAAQSAKRISRLHFADGAFVEKGEILVSLQSDAERAALREAQVNAREAERQLTRLRALSKAQAVAQADLDAQEYRVDSLRARVDLLSVALADLTLTAPFTGQLGLRQISEGAYVAPGTPIVSLVDNRRMKLDFSLPSIYLDKIRVGMPVVALSSALADSRFAGSIASLDPSIEASTRTLRVRAWLDNPQGLLKDGMLMRIEIKTAPRTAMMISESALVPLGGDNFVFVIDATGAAPTVARRAISIGERVPGGVEVLKGLAVGDKVVTHGLQRIRAGQAVSIAREAAPFALITDTAQQH